MAAGASDVDSRTSPYRKSWRRSIGRNRGISDDRRLIVEIRYLERTEEPSHHRFVESGEYALDQGETDPTPGWNAPEWGE